MSRQAMRSGLTLFEEDLLQRLSDSDRRHEEDTKRVSSLERRIIAMELREVVHEEGSLIQFNRVSELEQWRINTSTNRRLRRKLPD